MQRYEVTLTRSVMQIARVIVDATSEIDAEKIAADYLLHGSDGAVHVQIDLISDGEGVWEHMDTEQTSH